MPSAVDASGWKIEVSAADRARRKRYVWRIVLVLSLVALVVLIGLAGSFELRTLRGQARVLSAYAEEIGFELQPGPSDHILFPGRGPYDVRFGYAEMPAILERMADQPFRITAQARVSARFEEVVDWGLFPIYREKNQAGLRLADRDDSTFYQVRYPRYVYDTFGEVPPLVWQTLFYIENRNMLNPELPYRNPRSSGTGSAKRSPTRR